jgi:hypothetical protein
VPGFGFLIPLPAVPVAPIPLRRRQPTHVQALEDLPDPGRAELDIVIAITQLRCPGPGRDYVAKRMTAGDTKTEAIRALRRRISDEVFRRLQADEAAHAVLEGVAQAAA